MLLTKFKAPEPSGSGEEDFKYISVLNPRPHHRAILDPVGTIFTNLLEVH